MDCERQEIQNVTWPLYKLKQSNVGHHVVFFGCCNKALEHEIKTHCENRDAVLDDCPWVYENAVVV